MIGSVLYNGTINDKNPQFINLWEDYTTRLVDNSDYKAVSPRHADMKLSHVQVRVQPLLNDDDFRECFVQVFSPEYDFAIGLVISPALMHVTDQMLQAVRPSNGSALDLDFGTVANLVAEFLSMSPFREKVSAVDLSWENGQWNWYTYGPADLGHKAYGEAQGLLGDMGQFCPDDLIPYEDLSFEDPVVFLPFADVMAW